MNSQLSPALVLNHSLSPSKVAQYWTKQTDDYNVRVVTYLQGDELNVTNWSSYRCTHRQSEERDKNTDCDNCKRPKIWTV
jgi:hypothetical protein